MSFRSGYLTPRQGRFWSLRRGGLREADVSREMKVSRQAANKVFNVIDAKVSKALVEAARVHRIDVRQMDPIQGFLLGYNQGFESDVLITFSARNGIQVWYKNEGGCEGCGWTQSCRSILIAEAEERSIQLPEDKDSIPPSKLAEILFTKITGG